MGCTSSRANKDKSDVKRQQQKDDKNASPESVHTDNSVSYVVCDSDLGASSPLGDPACKSSPCSIGSPDGVGEEQKNDQQQEQEQQQQQQQQHPPLSAADEASPSAAPSLTPGLADAPLQPNVGHLHRPGSAPAPSDSDSSPLRLDEEENDDDDNNNGNTHDQPLIEVQPAADNSLEDEHQQQQQQDNEGRRSSPRLSFTSRCRATDDNGADSSGSSNSKRRGTAKFNGLEEDCMMGSGGSLNSFYDVGGNSDTSNLSSNLGASPLSPAFSSNSTSSNSNSNENMWKRNKSSSNKRMSDSATYLSDSSGGTASPPPPPSTGSETNVFADPNDVSGTSFKSSASDTGSAGSGGAAGHHHHRHRRASFSARGASDPLDDSGLGQPGPGQAEFAADGYVFAPPSPSVLATRERVVRE